MYIVGNPVKWDADEYFLVFDLLLRQIRDLLLPRLVGGEVDVGGVEVEKQLKTDA